MKKISVLITGTEEMRCLFLSGISIIFNSSDITDFVTPVMHYDNHAQKVSF